MNKSIKPGQIWLDDSGKRIYAHGSSIYYVDGAYYWIGENKEFTNGKDGVWTSGIRYYRSVDLMNWQDCGFLVEPSQDKDSPLNPKRMLDRPHLIHSIKNNKYVLWLKYIDTYNYCIMESDSFFGPYTIKKTIQPLGGKCGDYDLVMDEKTGQGYAYIEINHRDLVGFKLNEACDDVIAESAVKIYENVKPPLTREGPAHFERNGKHYLLTSSMTGYIPNRSEICVGDDYLGPYTIQGDPCVDDDSDATFNSQASCVFKVNGKDEYIMLADRWVPDFIVTKEIADKLRRAIGSNYYKDMKATLKEKLWMIFKTPLSLGKTDTSKSDFVMLPIQFKEDKAFIEWQDQWTPEI